MKKGFSLIELLIAIFIFAVIGVLTTSAISLTLRSSKKSDSLVRVRENVNYSLAVIERQIRNSESVDCVTSTSTNLKYTTAEGIDSTFSCISSYIASGASRLSSGDVSVTGCTFSCTKTDLNSPAVVKVSLTAEDATASSVEKGSVSTSMEIISRNY